MGTPNTALGINIVLNFETDIAKLKEKIQPTLDKLSKDLKLDIGLDHAKISNIQKDLGAVKQKLDQVFNTGEVNQYNQALNQTATQLNGLKKKTKMEFDDGAVRKVKEYNEGLGKTYKIIKDIDKDNNTVSTTKVTTTDYDKIASSTEKAKTKLDSYLTSANKLKAISELSTGIKDSGRSGDVKAKYESIVNAIKKVENSGQLMTAEQDRSIKRQIAGLQMLITQYKDIEKEQKTQLKGIESTKTKLQGYENILNNIKSSSNLSTGVKNQGTLGTQIHKETNDLLTSIQQIKNGNKAMTEEQDRGIKKQIAGIQSLVTSYKDAEKVQKTTQSGIETTKTKLQGYESILNKVKYNSVLGTGVKDEGMLGGKINEKTTALLASIDKIKNSNSVMTAEQERGIKKEIASIQLMTTAYNNAEKQIATNQKKNQKDIEQTQNKAESYLNTLNKIKASNQLSTGVKNEGMLGTSIHQKTNDLLTSVEQIKKSNVAMTAEQDRGIKKQIIGIQLLTRKYKDVENQVNTLVGIQKKYTQLASEMNSRGVVPTDKIKEFEKAMAKNIGTTKANSNIDGIKKDYRELVLLEGSLNNKKKETNKTISDTSAQEIRLKAIRGKINTVTNDTDQYRQLDASYNKILADINAIRSSGQAMSVQQKVEINGRIADLKNLSNEYLKQDKDRIKSSNDQIRADKQIADIQRDMATKIQNLQTKYKGLVPQKELEKFRQLLASLNSTDLKTVSDQLKNVRQQYAQLEANTREGGRIRGQGIMATLTEDLRKFSLWFGIGTVFMSVIHGIKDTISYVTKMDTALTNLGKVVDMTKSQMTDMKDTAVELGKSLGKSSTDIMEGMAEFGRVSKDLEQIKSLTKTAIMASNVTDLSTADASKALTTSMIAYKMNFNDSMQLLDQWNEIQNNFR